MTALIILCAKYLFVVAPLAAVVVFARCSPEIRRVLLLRGLVILVASIVLAKAGGALYNEPRPFVVRQVQPLIPHPADNGFPSDHTLLAAACAFLIVPFSPVAGGLAGIVALIVGASRIACLLHSPLDIAASLLFAAVAGGAAALAIRRRPITIIAPSPK
jgi:undecaprenyl-diphosphatase